MTNDAGTGTPVPGAPVPAAPVPAARLEDDPGVMAPSALVVAYSQSSDSSTRRAGRALITAFVEREAPASADIAAEVMAVLVRPRRPLDGA